MIVIISPAKTLDFSVPGPEELTSMPEFPSQAKTVAGILRTFSSGDLSELMNISTKLAYLNYDRYQKWKISDQIPEAKQAMLAYKGDVYNGLEAQSLSEADLNWAQDHLRILTGLYGVLRPLDLIMPYRLEFATKLKVKQYNNLYEYWEKHINRSFASLKDTDGSGTLIDLASAEYSKALSAASHDLRVITPVFKEYRNGSYRFLSMFGKKARGMMARYIIKERIEDPEQLKLFSDEGYSFNEPLSDGDSWVFTR
jgi:hypothetical protein